MICPMLTRGTQNCAYPMEHDPKLIAYVAARCDVLGTQELRHRNNSPIDIRPLLPAGWGTDQDASSGTRSATSISWNRRSVRTKRKFGLRALMTKVQLKLGRRIQLRDFDEVITIDPKTGARCHEIAVHLPLKSTGVQGAALRRLKRRINHLRRFRPKHSWCVYTDANMDIDELARYLGGKAVGGGRGRQIVGLVMSKNMRHLRATVDHHVDHGEHWTDHPFVIVASEATGRRKG